MDIKEGGQWFVIKAKGENWLHLKSFEDVEAAQEYAKDIPGAKVVWGIFKPLKGKS
jgi:hypothetical protein